MLTREQFREKFRFDLLNLMSEAWAVRKENTSDFGRLMDHHYLRVKNLIDEMYNALVPVAPKTNGTLPLQGAKRP